MLDAFSRLPPWTQALFATAFTWGVTALGAAAVFLMRHPRKTILDGMLGFSAGVMLAASYWSLLAPSIEMAETLELNDWLTAITGFIGGGLLLYIGDLVYQYHNKRYTNQSANKRCFLLIASITLHNIPEGLAVGVAFGSVVYSFIGAGLSAACMLALGIGLQNFPEGMAVSVPLLREGYSKGRAFFLGQLSGFVEPVAGVMGVLLVLRVRLLLPYMLSFAAGAMIYVVVQELIPESQENRHKGLMTFFTLLGFAVMMVLDVALG